MQEHDYGDGIDWPVVWKATHAGFTGEILQDESGDGSGDPREGDQLGTMVCWHPNYMLGDYQLKDGDGRGAVTTAFETKRGRTDFRSMAVLERYLRTALGAVVILPLYLLDHSGLSMTAGAPSVFDNPRVRSDHHGNGLGWDTTMVGYIYTTAERVHELCGTTVENACPGCGYTRVYDGLGGERRPRAICSRCGHAFKDLYAPADWEGTAVAWVAKQLDYEVRAYDAFLRGAVYWYRVTDPAGATIDSCGGYLAVNDGKDDGLDYVRDEIRSSLKNAARWRREANAAEQRERARAADWNIATVAR